MEEVLAQEVANNLKQAFEAQPTLWQEAFTVYHRKINEENKKLNSKECRQIHSISSSEQFMASLNGVISEESTSNASGKVATPYRRLIEYGGRLKDVLWKVEPFTRIISIFVSSNPQIAALIWGGLWVFLEAAIRFINTVDKVIEILEDFSRLMSLFQHQSEQLYVNNKSIEDTLVKLYTQYLAFFIDMIKLVKIKSRLNYLKYGFQSSYERKFSEHKAKIMKLTQTVDKAMGYDSYRNLNIIGKHIHRLRLSACDTSRPSLPCRIIPWPENSLFHGRTKLLQTIHGVLCPHGSSEDSQNDSRRIKRSVALYGLGGIGKTQIALCYCHRYKEAYKAIFWVAADTPLKLASEFTNIANRLFRASETAMRATSHAEEKERVMAWLRHTDEKWLIVFDNAQNWGIVKDYWPDFSSESGSIIITSRDQHWEDMRNEFPIIEPFPVKVFSETEGVELLLKITRPSRGCTVQDSHHQVAERAAAVALVRQLGGFPLAIRQIGCHINRTSGSVSEVLRLYRDRSSMKEVYASADESFKALYEHTVETVWKISFEQIKPNARKLLNLIAFLDPDSIPIHLFRTSSDFSETAAYKPVGFEFLQQDSRVELGNAIGDLRKISFVEKLRRELRIHRLVKERAINNMAADHGEFQSTFDNVVYLVREVFPHLSPLEESLIPKDRECQLYINHVLSLQAEFTAEDSRLNGSKMFAELLVDAAFYLWERGLPWQSKLLVETAQVVCTKVGVQDDILQQNIYTILGCVMQEQNDFNCAESYFREAEKLSKQRTQVTYISKVLLASAYNNLANIFSAQRRYVEAAELLTNSINIKKSLRGTKPEHSSSLEALLAFSYANLGGVLGQQKKWQESAEMFHKSLAIDSQEKVKRARTCHVYGCMRLSEDAEGAITAALELFKEAYELRRETLGDHFETSLTLHMLAWCRHRLGNYENAADHLREALRILKSDQSQENRCRTARSKYKLAMVLTEMSDQGKDEIQTLKQQAAEVLREYSSPAAERVETETDYDELVPYI